MAQPAQDNIQSIENFDSLTDEATQEKIGPIQAGQFVVSGDDLPPQKPPTDTPLQEPVLKPDESKSPDDLLSQIAQDTGGHAEGNNKQQIQSQTPGQPSPSQSMEQQLPPLQRPATPVTTLAQDTSLPQSTATPTTQEPSQPDPTPYTEPQAAPPPSQESSGGILKMAIIILGILILIAIIAGIVWFFVISKQKVEPVQSEAVDDIVLDDPKLPERRGPGFGDLSPTTTSATPSAQTQIPSPSPLILPEN